MKVEEKFDHIGIPKLHRIHTQPFECLKLFYPNFRPAGSRNGDNFYEIEIR